MKYFISSLIFVILIFQTSLAEDDTELRLITYRGIAKELGITLKTELLIVLQAQGAVNALDHCSEKAPTITAALSEKSKLKVGRTSLKVRNPANAPLAWQETVLKKFEERKAAGENPDELEFYEVVEEDGKKQTHYMKAIVATAPCLVCHGTEIESEVESQLKKLYPDDQAVGFKLGDLRGAFTLVEGVGDVPKTASE